MEIILFCGCAILPSIISYFLKYLSIYILTAFSLHCTAQASLVAAHGLQSMSASVVVMQGLSCPAACGIFLDKGLNSCPLHQWVDSLPLDHWTSLPFREVLHLCLLNLIITIEQFCFFLIGYIPLRSFPESLNSWVLYLNSFYWKLIHGALMLSC